MTQNFAKILSIKYHGALEGGSVFYGQRKPGNEQREGKNSERGGVPFLGEANARLGRRKRKVNTEASSLASVQNSKDGW